MASCSLSGDGMANQGRRYARLAPAVVESSREPRRLSVVFGPDYDGALLDEAVAVERECCPFFAIAVDHRARSLVIELASDEATALLDGISDALGAAQVA